MFVSGFRVVSPHLNFDISAHYTRGDIENRSWGLRYNIENLLKAIDHNVCSSVYISNHSIHYTGEFVIGPVTLKDELARQFHNWLKEILKIPQG